MDFVTSRQMELDVLKELLRDGVITFPQFLEGMAAVQSRVAAGSSGVGGAGSSSMRDVVEKSVESVSKVSVRTCELSENRDVVSEEENTSGVGVGATKGMSDEVLEEDHIAEWMGTQVAVTRCICGMDSEMRPIFNATRDVVSEEENTSGVGVGVTKGKSDEVLEEDQDVASSKGKDGILAALLHASDRYLFGTDCAWTREPHKDILSALEAHPPAARLGDSDVQQVTRMKALPGGEVALRPSVGAKRPRVRLRPGPSVGARPRVRLRPGHWNMLVARTALKEQAKAEAWRMEIQLVKMQIDAVTDDESVNLGCERSARWGSVTRW